MRLFCRHHVARHNQHCFTKIPLGGTAMFAFLAMAGDLGGAVGPGIVGLVTQAANDNLKIGVLAGCVFPAVLVLSVLY